MLDAFSFICPKVAFQSEAFMYFNDTVILERYCFLNAGDNYMNYMVISLSSCPINNNFVFNFLIVLHLIMSEKPNHHLNHSFLKIL